jgi:hypothetical protein
VPVGPLEKLASDIELKNIETPSDWCKPSSPTISSTGVFSLSPMTVHKVISNLTNHSPQEISIIHRIPINIIQSIAEETTSFARNIQNKLSIKKLSQTIFASSINDVVAYFKLDLNSIRQKKYADLRLRLSNQIPQDLAKKFAAIYPTIVKSDIYLSLDYPHLTENLLLALCELGVSAQDLGIKFQPNPKDQAKQQSTFNSVYSLCLSVWNDFPTHKDTEISHPSRPDSYLVWPAISGDFSTRGSDVHGLISLMFCVTIYHRIMEKLHATS